MRRALIAVTAAALAAAVLLLGGTLDESPDGATAQARTAAGTATTISRLEAAVRRSPQPARLVELGRAYELRARETSDGNLTLRAEQAYFRALRLDAGNLDATLGLGSVALSHHEFRRALILGRRAQRIDPETPLALAVIGDAQLELGRYDAAFRTFEQLVAEQPGSPAYARVAYGRELVGDRGGAAEAMRLALAAAAGDAEASAWTHVELGNLAWGEGRVRAAANEYSLALRALPGYLPALDGLARVHIASGRSEAAIRLARRTTEAVTLPHFITTLANALWLEGRRGEARRQWRVVEALERKGGHHGGADPEVIAFMVDRGLQLPRTLKRAREAHRRQPSIEADDVLGWALVRNGRCAEGLRYAERSLRLGTENAGRYFRRGMASRCLGDDGEARRWFRRAVELNPHFSPIWGPVAVRLAG